MKMLRWIPHNKRNGDGVGVKAFLAERRIVRAHVEMDSIGAGLEKAGGVIMTWEDKTGKCADCLGP